LSVTGPSSSASRIDVRSLGKRYRTARGGEVVALRELSLEIPAGAFVSVVGPSGCGKSTLLKIIAGIIAKTEGSIAMDGQEIAGPNAKIGVAFQSPVLLPWRTVLDNVLLPVDAQRMSRTPFRDRAAELLQLFGLAGFEDKYPFELSGGMQQRAAICRALVNDPSVLLMDEPFGALDAMTREYMNVWLQDLWLKSGKTILFITHSIPEAVFLGDRVVVMSSRPGTVEELIEVDIARPRTLQAMTSERFGAYVTRIRGRFGADAVLG
jgi:NitT/TauT family transport system ATP-binding protein